MNWSPGRLDGTRSLQSGTYSQALNSEVDGIGLCETGLVLRGNGTCPSYLWIEEPQSLVLSDQLGNTITGVRFELSSEASLPERSPAIISLLMARALLEAALSSESAIAKEALIFMAISYR